MATMKGKAKATQPKGEGQVCIFCRRPSGDSMREAHLFPEAVVPDGLVLTRGVECDQCNGYAGANLENVLVRHPLIAMPLQLVGVPGKGGKPRTKLGVFERGVVPGATVTFPIEPPKTYYGPDGMKRWTMTPAHDPHLDYARFSRALHYIALRVVAHTKGPATALSSEFDAARRFARCPVNGKERWPHAEVCEHMANIRPHCAAELLPLDGARVVRLSFYSADFYVDLLNSGLLLTMRFTGPAHHATVIGPHWVPPVPKPPEPDADGMVRYYRASIE